MTPYGLRRILVNPTSLHILCAAIALGCCIAILYPGLCPHQHQEAILHHAGTFLLASIGTSAALMLLSAATHMLRLSNTRAIWQLIKWSMVWGTATLCFLLLAIIANAPPPEQQKHATPIQTTDTLHPAKDTLLGPASLSIPITPADQDHQHVAPMPHLTHLENNHGELLRYYLDHSPRWTGRSTDDTFYSKPGHLVMEPPTTSGVPGLVHVSFRRLIGGDRLPEGYTTVHPGDPMPPPEDDKNRIPDLAIDLGKDHYLLLAWRGTSHTETAYKALNAAITAIDTRLQPLAENPTPETVEKLLQGKLSFSGKMPEIRLCEPPSQDGTYQAEIYANPGEPGTILLYIKNISTGQTLRLLNCPAQHSPHPDEQFRHDIPGSVPEWMHTAFNSDLNKLFPRHIPLFAICRGKQHQYFGAAFEVWFKPSDIQKPRRLLLRRCYTVQPYAPIHPPPHADEENPATPRH